MKTTTANQAPTPEKDIQKKIWETPFVVVIDRYDINAGTHPGGIEVNYAPGHIDSSPAFYNFFS